MRAVIRGLLGALIFALVLVSSRNAPVQASPAGTFPVDASLVVVTFTPSPPDSSFWQSFGCLPLNPKPQGWTTSHLFVQESGSIVGQCDFSDAFTTSTGTVTGSIDFTEGDVEINYQGMLTLEEAVDDIYNISWNGIGTYDSPNHRATGTGTYSWTCNADDCPGAASGGGTLTWSLTLALPDAADLTIDHIEVVQVVQDATNSVPLVANKGTVARVFAKTNVAVVGATVELKAISQSGTATLLNPTAMVTTSPNRAEVNHSFNFRLPAAWTEAGNLTLEAVVKPPADVTEADQTNNTQQEQIEFTQRAGLNIRYLRVCTQPGGVGAPSCPSDFVASYHTLLQELFPIADGAVSYGALSVPQWNWPKAINTNAANYEVNAALRKRFDLIEGMGETVPDQLAGWLPRSAGNPIYGLSDPLWAAGFGRISVQQDTRDLDPLDPAFTVVHEIAHNLGRRHANLADSCDAKDDSTDWPYADSTIQEIGYDIDANEVVPSSKKDVTTYCSPPTSNIWISPHTFTELFEGNFSPQRVRTAGAGTEYMVISGSAKADGSGGELDPAYVVTSNDPADPSDPNGTHCLRFTGATTTDYCFTLEFEEHRTHQDLDENFFSLRIALPAGMTRAALMHGSDELAALEESPAAPTIDITSPQAGEAWTGEETITWSGSDTDGDPLVYAVLYTPDDGDTWLPIDVDTAASQFSFDTGSLASSAVMIRVLASDGLNTTAATVGPVILGGARPWGDLDCNTEIDPIDSLKILRDDAGLPNTQPEGCPDLGDSVNVPGVTDAIPWGDVDCNGDVDPVDSLKVLRDDAGLPTTPIGGCPALGDPVVASPAALATAERRWRAGW